MLLAQGKGDKLRIAKTAILQCDSLLAGTHLQRSFIQAVPLNSSFTFYCFTGHAMWKQKVSKITLKIIEKCFSTLTKPFVEADSLSSYSKKGYILLGFILAIPVLILWWRGYLSTPLSQSHPIIRGIYLSLAEKTYFFNHIPDSYVSLIILPVIIYIVLFFWPSKLQLIGEATANACFWLIEKIINIGEWYIEHRWYSFSLIIALSFVLAALVTFEAYKFSDERKIRNDFDYWLKDAEDFVKSNAFSKQETERYTRVQSYWRRDFGAMLRRPSGDIHPALCLNDMLDNLYAESASQTWIEVLQRKVGELNEQMNKCAPVSTDNMELSEARAWALMNLLMGRINIRLVEDPEGQPYSNLQELKKALDYFGAVEKLQYKAPEYVHLYRSDASNGKGTVYVNAFSAYMRGKSAPLSSEQLTNLKAVCAIPSQCAALALEAYETAGNGFEACSFQDKRKLNNTTDLLLRIGRYYNDDLAREFTTPPFANWMRDHLALEHEIESHIQALMTCNTSEPFLPTFALTVAQGYGVSAKLKLDANSDAVPSVMTAARYLRLANSFDSKNVRKKELAYFCAAVKNPQVSETFHQALTATSEGLPSAEDLFQFIQRKCQ